MDCPKTECLCCGYPLVIPDNLGVVCVVWKSHDRGIQIARPGKRPAPTTKRHSSHSESLHAQISPGQSGCIKIPASQRSHCGLTGRMPCAADLIRREGFSPTINHSHAYCYAHPASRSLRGPNLRSSMNTPRNPGGSPKTRDCRKRVPRQAAGRAHWPRHAAAIG